MTIPYFIFLSALILAQTYKVSLLYAERRLSVVSFLEKCRVKSDGSHSSLWIFIWPLSSVYVL